MSNVLYCSYNAYSVKYNLKTKEFEIGCKDNKKCLSGMKLSKLYFQGTEIDFAEYTETAHRTEAHSNYLHTMKISYTREKSPMKNITLQFDITPKGVKTRLHGDAEGTGTFIGKAQWGKNFPEDTFAMSSKENGSNLRSAIGPTTSNIDDMLFDRLTDTALQIDGGHDFRFKYNWTENIYDFTLNTGIILGERSFHVSRVEDIMSTQYNMDYAPINKKPYFPSLRQVG